MLGPHCVSVFSDGGKLWQHFDCVVLLHLKEGERWRETTIKDVDVYGLVIDFVVSIFVGSLLKEWGEGRKEKCTCRQVGKNAVERSRGRWSPRGQWMTAGAPALRTMGRVEGRGVGDDNDTPH